MTSTSFLQQAFPKAEMPEGFRTLFPPTAQGGQFISEASAFDLGPHTTLWNPSTLYRSNLVTRVQWMKMQEHSCSHFKRYASPFHRERYTNAINTKVINLELKSFLFPIPFQ